MKFYKCLVWFIVFFGFHSCSTSEAENKELVDSFKSEDTTYELYQIFTKVDENGWAQCSKYYFHKTSDTGLHIYGASVQRLLSTLLNQREEYIHVAEDDSLKSEYFELKLSYQDSAASYAWLKSHLLDFWKRRLVEETRQETVYEMYVRDSLLIRKNEVFKDKGSIQYKKDLFHFKGTTIASVAQVLDGYSDFILVSNEVIPGRYDFKLPAGKSPQELNELLSSYGLGLKKAQGSVNYYKLITVEQQVI